MLNDWLTTMILGGVFVLLGLGGVLWGKKEASEDYQSITARADVHTDTRKFLEDWESNSGSGALKMGGLLAIIVGLFLLVLGTVFLLQG